ncbi:MAG: isopentenyl-diphosphate delta-isomerase [Flaviaesturariibacter sp.]|nr:isopentenyl-diphosphate delta-isomerase [Flaviaesturariibacter sp.]
MQTEVILVNEQDEPIGVMEKMEAHQKGALHRAFSIFVFDKAGKLLLQQRAAQKYHGGGLWTNTCCSHPFPDETAATAATRRLEEEMGFTTPLQKVFDFTYQAVVENGLVEHEFDHVFVGEYEGTIRINENEVAAYGWEAMPAIKEAITKTPANFTTWFRIVFPRIEAWWQQQYSDKKEKVESI